MNVRGVSQTGICLYRFCPYAYKLKYANNCEPMVYDYSAMDTGKYVHDSIKEYYWFKFSLDNDADDILYETYSCLRNIWDISLTPELFKKAYDCLVTHSKWEYQNIVKKIPKPLSEVEIDQNKIEKREDGYYGFLDYVSLFDAKVIDFKTGVHPTVSFDYRIQAYVYKILFETNFKIKLKDYYLFYLYPNEWRKISYDKQKQIDAGKEAERLLRKILDREFPKKPRLSCKYCDYKYYCRILQVN